MITPLHYSLGVKARSCLKKNIGGVHVTWCVHFVKFIKAICLQYYNFAVCILYVNTKFFKSDIFEYICWVLGKQKFTMHGKHTGVWGHKERTPHQGQEQWLMPVISAPWEAEAQEFLEPARWRLQWANITPLHSRLCLQKNPPIHLCCNPVPVFFTPRWLFEYLLCDRHHLDDIHILPHLHSSSLQLCEVGNGIISYPYFAW